MSDLRSIQSYSAPNISARQRHNSAKFSQFATFNPIKSDLALICKDISEIFLMFNTLWSNMSVEIVTKTSFLTETMSAAVWRIGALQLWHFHRPLPTNIRP